MGRETEDELDKYISDVSGLEADDTSTDVTTGDDHGDGGNGPAADGAGDGEPNGEAAQATTQPDNGATPKQKVNDPKGKQSQQGTQNPTQQQARPLGDGTFADAKGNIVDKDGKLIAQGGFAARMYNSNRRLKALSDSQGQELETLHRQVGEFRALSTSIQQYGLDN